MTLKEGRRIQQRLKGHRSEDRDMTGIQRLKYTDTEIQRGKNNSQKDSGFYMQQHDGKRENKDKDAQRKEAEKIGSTKAEEAKRISFKEM